MIESVLTEILNYATATNCKKFQTHNSASNQQTSDITTQNPIHPKLHFDQASNYFPVGLSCNWLCHLDIPIMNAT